MSQLKQRSIMPLFQSDSCPNRETNCNGCKICKTMVVVGCTQTEAENILSQNREEVEIINVAIICK